MLFSDLIDAAEFEGKFLVEILDILVILPELWIGLGSR